MGRPGGEAGGAEVLGSGVAAGTQVVHIALPGEATSDKQQIVGKVGGHADGLAAGRASMNSSAVPRRMLPRKMSPANRSPA
jgi:hypothetical protein